MSTESSHQSRRLDVLLVDYEASRDDDRQQQVQIAALFGVGATLLAALYAIVLQAAPFNSATTALRLNPVIIFFLPMIPLILLAYTIWFSAGISLRGYYLRALEREISAQAGTTVELHGQLPVPSLAHLEVLLFRTGPGGPVRMRLISNLVGLVSFVGLCGGASLCLLALRPWVVRLAFILVYVPIIMIVFWVAWTTFIKPRRFFHSLYDRFTGEFADPLDSLHPARPAGQRRLASYLIVPRLGELLKSSLYFFFAALALLTYGSTSVRSVLIYWIIFELLSYQARYAWNDLRDLTREHSHPGRNARGRIPEVGTMLFRIIIVETMIVARIGFAIALLWLLPAGVERYVGAYLLISLTILSICYEAIRSRTFKVRSGRFHLLEWTVYIAIALGYGLRGSAGFWYGSAGSARLATLVIVFLTCSALGAAGVLVLWLYEADMLARESGMHIIPSHLALLLRAFNRSKKAVRAAPPKGGVPPR